MSSLKKIISVLLFRSLIILIIPVNSSASKGSLPEEESSQKVTTSQEISKEVFGQNENRIAVFDMKGIGISDLAVKTLSDHLRNELERTSTFTSIGPATIDDILQQNGFQEIDPNSVEWVKEVGGLLGVRQMMMGSLGKVFDKYIIDLRIYTVESGAVEKSMTQSYRGNVDGLILEIEKLAWNMVGLTAQR